MNQQPIEKQHLNEDVPIARRTVDVHSVFFTIQGEGPFVGTPSVFVRLAGCNLQCPLCDTDYTSSRFQVTPEALEDCVATVQRDVGGKVIGKAPLVVITGGEPFRQDITFHVWALLDAGYQVQIETNGTLFIRDFPYDRVTVVCSPKTGKINAQLLPHITALKYVIRAGEVMDDGLPVNALGHAAHPRVARPPQGFKGTVYVQPVDEAAVPHTPGHVMLPSDPYQRNLAAAIRSAMAFGYTLGVQLHKIIGKE